MKPAVLAILAAGGGRIGSRVLRQWWLRGWRSRRSRRCFAGVPFPLVIAAAALSAGSARASRPRRVEAEREPAVDRAARAALDRRRYADAGPRALHARASRAYIACWRGARRRRVALLVAATGGAPPFPPMARFFTQAALLTFGGAYAVLPYVFQGAVETHGWLSAPR